MMSDAFSSEIQAILSSLSGSPAILEGLLLSIPTDALQQKRGQGFWSLHEHAAHLADVQPMILERLRRIISEEMAEFVPFIPGEDETAGPPALPSVEMILTRFRSVREEQIELLGKAGKSVWEKCAIHPEYDQYGLLILARHILMHDHWHMYRMEELWLTKDEFLTKLEG
jgi:hypothetical protein